jgi:hypothetical protein
VLLPGAARAPGAAGTNKVSRPTKITHYSLVSIFFTYTHHGLSGLVGAASGGRHLRLSDEPRFHGAHQEVPPTLTNFPHRVFVSSCLVCALMSDDDRLLLLSPTSRSWRDVEGAVVVVIAGGGRRARECGAPVGAGRAGPAAPPRQPEATGAGGHRTMTTWPQGIWAGCTRLHARRVAANIRFRVRRDRVV